MPEPKFLQIDITYQSLLRIIVVGFLAIALVTLREIIIALLFAVVVASAIEPGVRWFGRYHIPRIAAVLIIYIVALGVISGAIYLVVPAIVGEFTAFLDSFPR